MFPKAARIVSTFSHPVIIFPTSVPFFVAQAQWSWEKLFLFWPALLVLSFPLLYFFYALRAKRISDWEVTERRERYTIYFLSLLCGGVALWFLGRFGSPNLFTFGLIFYLLGIFITVINFFWKISAHTAGITTGALTFNLLLDQTTFLYLLIPIVAWSRWEEKKHTLTEILGGVALGAVVVLSVLNLHP